MAYGAFCQGAIVIERMGAVELASPVAIGARNENTIYWADNFSPDGTVMAILLPELAKFRQLGFAITSRAKLTAAEGNNDKAMKDILTCYRFGLHQSEPEFLVEQFVGISIRALALDTTFKILDRTTVDRDLLRALQRQIEEPSIDEHYIPDMRGEKLMVIDVIQRIFTDEGKGGGQIHMESAKAMLPMRSQQAQSLENLQRRQTTEAVEKAFEYFEFVGQKTPWQWKNEQINPEKEIKKIKEKNAFVKMFCPAYVKVAQLFARCRAETDALITTLALLRYKSAKGQLPANLDELVSAGYLKALPTDPFSGSPFVYKRIGDDFMLYSFGVDCDDDGGTRSKWGIGEKGGDQVFWPIEPMETAKDKANNK